MMPTYRNVGSSLWRRPSDCTAVAPGATFEATKREHEALQRRPWMRKRIVLIDPTPRVEDTDDEVLTKDEVPSNDETITQDETATRDEVPTQDEAVQDEAPPAWDLIIPPARYLQLYPQGPRAAVAQQIVDGETPPEE